MKKQQLLKKAAEHFMKKDFQKAQNIYKTVLQNEPSDKEAKLGMILCDIADEDEEEALALFDYYIILKEEKEQHPEESVLAMIDSFDSAMEIETIFNIENIGQTEGISYKEFKSIVESRGSFKRAFEDIMFSTKVIITKKGDFFDFIDNLIEHGFTDIVYGYLEDATKLYPTDKKIQEFIDKLHSEKV